MDLHKFADDLKGDPPAPPYRISASKLDGNFSKCYPKDWDGNEKPYTVKREDDGFLFEFPFWPPPQKGTYVLGVVEGKIKWLPTEDCENEEE